LALGNRLPTISSLRDYVAAGGLMSYGENLSNFFAARRVVRGQDHPGCQTRRFAGRAADEILPSGQSQNGEGARFDAIPESFLIRADEVIE